MLAMQPRQFVVWHHLDANSLKATISPADSRGFHMIFPRNACTIRRTRLRLCAVRPFLQFSAAATPGDGGLNGGASSFSPLSRRQQTPTTTTTFRTASSSALAAPVTTAAKGGTTSDDEEVENLAENLSVGDLWALLKTDARLITMCALATLFSVATSVCVAPCLGRVIDVISTAGSTNKQLGVAVGTLGAVYLCSNLSLAAQVALANASGESLAARLRARLFRALLGRSASFYDTARTGAMTAWLGQDVEVLQSTVAKLLGARGLRAVLETVGIIGVLTWLSWPMALALLIAAPAVSPVVAAATRRIRGASQESQAAAASASAAADEVVENMRIVRAFGAETKQLSRYQQLVDAAYALSLRVIRIQALLDISGRARNTICVLVTLSLGAHLALAGKVAGGEKVLLIFIVV